MKKNYIQFLIILLIFALSACSLAPEGEISPPASSTPWLPDPATPTSSQLLLKTYRETDVHLGPGKSYDILYILPENTSATVIGRNLNSTWWVVSDSVNGGQGWVSAAETEIFGSTDSLPILAAPTITPVPEVPLIGKEFPEHDICEVTDTDGSGGPVYVYAGPGRQDFSIVAVLGMNRWVTVINLNNSSDWYQVQDETGIIGWINVEDVAHNGYCPPEDEFTGLPMIENPGSPPSDVCLANRPGQFPPVEVYLGPGRQFALVAYLGNWAEILKSESDWHLILVGPGDVGWVSGEAVDITGPCVSN
jgi:uncharacterized protein YgiM (DUF1202 family)